MTKGKRTISKTNDGSSESLRRALCFGQGESGPAEDVGAVNLDSLEETEEEIVGIANLPRPVQIPTIRIFYQIFINLNTLFYL